MEREHSYFVHVAKARAWRQRGDMVDDVRKMEKTQRPNTQVVYTPILPHTQL